MKNQKTSLVRIAILLIIAFIVIGVGTTLAVISRKPTNKPADILKTSDGTVGQTKPKPIRLKISKINVDAQVELMGLTPAGDMEAPSSSQTVGWYKYGPHPGEVGNAVIDGHFGPWQNGEGSVFDNLSKLKKGDSMSVVSENGTENIFVVRELRTYDKNANTSEVFGNGDGQAHLNIITCTGSWNKNQKAYSSRLVVFADKV